MKVLQVHDFVAPGNSRSGLDMCRQLLRRGHEVHVMGAVGPLGPPADIPSHTYPWANGSGIVGRLLYARRMNREIFERALEGFEPDVLFFMQPLCTNQVLRSPRAGGRRRAYHFFSPWAREWEIEHGARVPSALWAAVNTDLRRASERKALDRVGRVLCASRFMRDQLLQQHPDYPADRITILPGAVDLEQFRPAAGQRSDERFTIFTMRRHVRRMGLDLLIRAAALLPAVRLVVGGDGPERGALDALAGGLGLRDRVEFIGYVPDEALPRLYSEADLVVLPTRALEGFGLVLIEAMACGTPAMGTRVGGIPEVLEPLDPGLVIPEASVEAIAASIRAFMNDDGRRRDLRARCRPYVAERFGWDVVAPILVEALS
jgi:glycosyltransferase involved in cell wall biosynthesis